MSSISYSRHGSASLRILVLAEAASSLEQAPSRDTESFLAGMDDVNSEGHFGEIVNMARYRIEVTERLNLDRENSVKTFSLGEKILGWEVFTAWLECEQLIQDSMALNVMMYDMRLDYLIEFGTDKGWNVSEFESFYSALRNIQRQKAGMI
jgi:hypothetical protein